MDLRTVVPETWFWFTTVMHVTEREGEREREKPALPKVEYKILIMIYLN